MKQEDSRELLNVLKSNLNETARGRYKSREKKNASKKYRITLKITTNSY